MSDPSDPNPAESPAAASVQDAGTTESVPTSAPQHPAQHPGTSAGSTAWTTWVPAPDHRPAAEPPAPATPTAPVPAGPSVPPAAPPPQYQRRAKAQVTYLPPPSGANWGLVVVGLLFGLVGAGVVANQVAGFEVASLTDLGPSVLVVAGLACALLGLVGIVTRRRRG